MKIGDLVRHKYNGGVGIIVDSRLKHSNITMGIAQWFNVQWIERGENQNRTTYLPAYLELIDSTDKN